MASNYYVLDVATKSNTPYLSLNYGINILAKKRPAPRDIELEFESKANFSDAPDMADYVQISYPACSTKLKACIDSLGIEGVDWVPAKGVVAGEEYCYSIFRVLNFVDCIDRDRSDLVIDELGKISDVRGLALSYDAMQEVERKRLEIFRTKQPLIYFVSQRVADALRASECTGLAITPVEEWSYKLSASL